MKDLVSIITPSYNTGQFISETIKSVLTQTYQNWEMIIIDDCSTDNTNKVVSSFEDSRIRYITNERNIGAALSRNRALREANGKWIAFLDSDDLWEPEKLEKQIAFMEVNGYHFSCTAALTIDENSNLLGKMHKSPIHITKFGMRTYCWIWCLTVMYDADYVGLIQIADLKKNNDYAMWLKIIQKCDCYALNENLSRYRIRKNSISRSNICELIKSHYALFRHGENMSVIASLLWSGCNMVCGLINKMVFMKRKNFLK